MDGTAELLAYEQGITLQQGVYDRDRSMYRQLSSWYVGIAQPMSSPLPGDGVTFQQHVPGGDLGDFDDRWRWIEESMLPAWREREAELRPAIAELSR